MIKQNIEIDNKIEIDDVSIAECKDMLSELAKKELYKAIRPSETRCCYCMKE